jgi:hypothetical protein
MKLIKTEDEQGVMYSLSGDNLPENYVLSKENCDSLFGVVDVEKLDKKIRGLMMISGTSNGTIDHPNTDKMISLFNKAMELNDKLFTKEDMRKCYKIAKDRAVMQEAGLEVDLGFDNFIQSLQQPKEIEVEICKLMDCISGKPCNGTSFECNHCTNTGIPKLDSEGCLILKKI